MAIQKHTLPDTNSAIWAETDNLNYFSSLSISPDSSTGVTNEQSQVAGHNRRQYPGDQSLSEVDSHPRVFMKDPGRKSGNAVPGRPFVISDGTEKRQMRYTGRFMDVHAFFVGNVTVDTTLWSPTGTRYVISADGTDTTFGARKVDTLTVS